MIITINIRKQIKIDTKREIENKIKRGSYIPIVTLIRNQLGEEREFISE